jgi:hypothetical protein
VTAEKIGSLQQKGTVHEKDIKLHRINARFERFWICPDGGSLWAKRLGIQNLESPGTIT